MRAGTGALITLAACLAATGLAVVALATAGRGAGTLAVLADPSVLHALRFTLVQAGLSMLLSVLTAIPVALALARRSALPGRRAVLALFTIPLALPPLIAVFGLTSIFGNAGWLGGFPIYGLSGILLAHVYFNMPFAVLMLLARLEAIPGESWRLAGQLGFSPADSFRLIEWPALRGVLPGVAATVFLLCVTSFTIVLTLGGGPAATTLEVAIYEALRYDFDPPRAVVLALLQLGLSLGLMALLSRLGGEAHAMPGFGRRIARPGPASRGSLVLDGAIILCAALFVALPLAAVVAGGLGPSLVAVLAEPKLWRAIATSLAIATMSSALAVAGGWSLVAAARGRSRIADLAGKAISGGALVLALPPFVIGAGWFLLLNRAGLAFAAAPVVVAGMNALMALPFAARILAASDAARTRDHDRLCEQLGLGGWARFSRIDWPLNARAFAFAAALCGTFSLGDLGIAALFGSERMITLPLLLHQRLGSYRATDAGAIALVLMLLCLLIFVTADRIGRRAAGGGEP